MVVSGSRCGSPGSVIPGRPPHSLDLTTTVELCKCVRGLPSLGILLFYSTSRNSRCVIRDDCSEVVGDVHSLTW